MKTYHILRTPKSGWVFKEEDAQHIIKNNPDKLWLTDFAESYCRTHESELIVHKMSGAIDYRRRFDGFTAGTAGD